VDRFGTLLYGIGEAAGYLAVPPSTLTTWAYGYERRRAGARNATAPPIVTAVRPERPGDPAVPFIGLAEAYALAAFRHAGVPMQRIRPAIDVLGRELGLEHALARSLTDRPTRSSFHATMVAVVRQVKWREAGHDRHDPGAARTRPGRDSSRRPYSGSQPPQAEGRVTQCPISSARSARPRRGQRAA
jgi:hypothetical protein